MDYFFSDSYVRAYFPEKSTTKLVNRMAPSESITKRKLSEAEGNLRASEDGLAIFTKDFKLNFQSGTDVVGDGKTNYCPVYLVYGSHWNDLQRHSDKGACIGFLKIGTVRKFKIETSFEIVSETPWFNMKRKYPVPLTSENKEVMFAEEDVMEELKYSIYQGRVMVSDRRIPEFIKDEGNGFINRFRG